MSSGVLRLQAKSLQAQPNGEVLILPNGTPHPSRQHRQKT
jgi:hypothetical protein